jgi:hypothetical protein
VRRIELELGVAPSHYEPNPAPASPEQEGHDQEQEAVRL